LRRLYNGQYPQYTPDEKAKIARSSFWSLYTGRAHVYGAHGTKSMAGKSG